VSQKEATTVHRKHFTNNLLENLSATLAGGKSFSKLDMQGRIQDLEKGDLKEKRMRTRSAHGFLKILLRDIICHAHRFTAVIIQKIN